MNNVPLYTRKAFATHHSPVRHGENGLSHPLFQQIPLSAPQSIKRLGFAHAKAGLETRNEGAGAPFGMSLIKQG